MARSLLLIPTVSYRAQDFLEAARRLGIEVVVGGDRRQVLEAAVPGRTLTLDFAEPRAAVATIERFAQRYPLDAVVGVDEETTLVATEAAHRLGLPANPVESVAITRNKFRLRQRLAQAGLPGPRYERFRVDDDPRALASRVHFPCVVKPTFLAASRGVIRANDPDEFTAAHARIAALLADPELRRRGGDEARYLLVEEYVPGEEFAVEALVARGRLFVLALFDKPDPLEGPFFEETIYVTPSRACAETQRRIVSVLECALRAIGITEGPVHAEMRVNRRGVFVLEVATRSIGGHCSRVLRFGAGTSLEELILRHALGCESAPEERESGAAGVMMIPIPRAGILKSASGLEAARQVPGVDRIEIAIPIGQRVVPLPEGNRYLGFIFARAATPNQVEAALRQAHRRLAFDIASE